MTRVDMDRLLKALNEIRLTPEQAETLCAKLGLAFVDWRFEKRDTDFVAMGPDDHDAKPFRSAVAASRDPNAKYFAICDVLGISQRPARMIIDLRIGHTPRVITLAIVPDDDAIAETLAIVTEARPVMAAGTS